MEAPKPKRRGSDFRAATQGRIVMNVLSCSVIFYKDMIDVFCLFFYACYLVSSFQLTSVYERPIAYIPSKGMGVLGLVRLISCQQLKSFWTGEVRVQRLVASAILLLMAEIW